MCDVWDNIQYICTDNLRRASNSCRSLLFSGYFPSFLCDKSIVGLTFACCLGLYLIIYMRMVFIGHLLIENFICFLAGELINQCIARKRVSWKTVCLRVWKFIVQIVFKLLVKLELAFH